MTQEASLKTPAVTVAFVDERPTATFKAPEGASRCQFLALLYRVAAAVQEASESSGWVVKVSEPGSVWLLLLTNTDSEAERGLAVLRAAVEAHAAAQERTLLIEDALLRLADAVEEADSSPVALMNQAAEARRTLAPIQTKAAEVVPRATVALPPGAARLPYEIELHLTSDREMPRRFGAAVKRAGGSYSAARGYELTRYVHLPFTEQAIALGADLLRAYGAVDRSRRGTLCAVVIFRYHPPEKNHVRYIPMHREPKLVDVAPAVLDPNPMATALKQEGLASWSPQ